MNTIWPRAQRTLPLPWHGAQRPSGVRTDPSPRQASHVSCRVTTICRSMPRIDSSNAIVTAPWMSAPGSAFPVSGPAAGCSASAKSSVNVAACGPCAPAEKSNPVNSNVAAVPSGTAVPAES